MFRARFVVACCLLLPAAAAAQPPAHDATDAAIERFGEGIVHQHHAVGLAVGVIRDGEVYERFFGTTRRGGDTVPDGKTLFGIGSLTKTFAAALLAEAVHEHVVRLDDPVVEYLRGVPPGGPAKRSITLLELADHGSGIPRAARANGRRLTYRDMNAELATRHLEFAPGHGYLYSNLAFGFLGEAEMHAFHAGSWAHLVKSRITRPLGMPDTMVKVNPGKRARLAHSYFKNGREAPFHRPVYPGDQAAGAIVSDLDDMMTYLSWMMGTGPTSPGAAELDAIRPLLLTPHNPTKRPGMEVGLAWQMSDLPDGRILVEKDGLALGFVSWVGYIEASDVGVVVLGNSRSGWIGPARHFLLTLAHADQRPDTGTPKGTE